MKPLQIWHRGLMARDWGEFATDGGAEAFYFQKLVEAFGQPALDLGCGSGRILLPLLRAGLDVDGADFSADMLAQCQKRAGVEGLAPRLYEQATYALDLPRRYKTIFACGTLGLGSDKELTQVGIRRCYDHLRPGGVFAFDYSPRWNEPPAWLSRLPENRHALPEAWGESGERSRLSDGCDLESTSRTVSMDPLEDIATRQVRLRLWRGEELLTEEIHTQEVQDYSKNEWVLMLQIAGFSEITVQGNYTEEPATADHNTLVFIARK